MASATGRRRLLLLLLLCTTIATASSSGRISPGSIPGNQWVHLNEYGGTALARNSCRVAAALILSHFNVHVNYRAYVKAAMLIVGTHEARISVEFLANEDLDGTTWSVIVTVLYGTSLHLALAPEVDRLASYWLVDLPKILYLIPHD
ncbi:hypothetical protein AXF42_Ash000328 [Apostasia shenzhenica]|uniref:Uncharacterized protein n=1 Tax=Apostasia shenzhenica TaxID=1088818 RepID=A0A2I0AG12_9ASPA|nr:hypothetical protein AXF42_Ash000328 [Apostasia shenzhenica]